MFFFQLALASTLLFGTFVSALPVTNSTTANVSPRALPKVVTTCVKSNQVALTFDDGPYDYAYDIVKTLNNNNAKGTFFVNGNNYRCIYEDESAKRVKYLLSSGHQVASHTWSHPHLPNLNDGQIRTEMTRINTALKKTVGRVPKFFRPPYGEYNDDVRSVAASLGQTVVTWSDDSGDSVGVSLDRQKKVYNDFVAKKRKTGIFLNHEVKSTTAYQLLPYAIQKLQSAGYQMVTVAECLGEEPYLSQAAPSSRDGSWSC